MKKFFLVFLAGMVVTNSYAEDFDNNTRAGLPLSTTSVLLIVGVVGGSLTSTGIYVDEYSLRDLNIQQDALAMDLSVGDGEQIRDIAAFFGIPGKDYRQFAKFMRTERKNIMMLLEQDNIEELEVYLKNNFEQRS